MLFLFRNVTLIFATIACPLVLLSGCGSGSSSAPPGQRLHGQTSERHFEQAIQNLKRLEDFDVQVLSNRVVSDLNHWIEDEPGQDNWEQDIQLKNIHKAYRDTALPLYGRLEEMSFGYDDFYYLRQAVWARDVANWVIKQSDATGFEWLINRVKASATSKQREQIENSPDKLLAAIQVAHPSLSSADASNLTAAVRLFDWTIRNVQLTALQKFTPVGSSQRTIKQPNGSEIPVWSFPSLNGLPGPGYMQQPWQVMLYGEGDAWQRARLFIQLARQVGITGVMLAVEESEPVPWNRPWLPAVHFDRELYLLDSNLGLPIPSIQGPGIATLAELTSEPDSVRAWDVPNPGAVKGLSSAENSDHQIRYPLEGSDHERIGVLIDASFPALSKRMAHLEDKLVGQDKLVLTVRPSELAPDLFACKDVQSVQIWRVPLDAYLYRLAAREQLASSEDNRAREVLKTRIFGEVNDFFRARHLHFRGRLRGDREARLLGAIDYYQKADRSDEQILRLVHHNKQTLAAMANPSSWRSKEDTEATAFSTTDDPAARKVPEAKWLSLTGLRRALEENNVNASEEDLKKMLGSELSLKAMHSRYWMAIALYELQSFPNSADWLRRLQTKFRGRGAAQWSTGSRYNLARAYEAMGDIERARKLYQADQSPQRAGSVIRARLLEVKPQKGVDAEP